MNILKKITVALIYIMPISAAYAADCRIATRSDVPGDINDMIHQNKYDFKGYDFLCSYLKTFNSGIEASSATSKNPESGIVSTGLSIRLFDLRLAQETGKFLYSTSATNVVWSGPGTELNSQIEAVNQALSHISLNVVYLERQRKLFGIKQ